MGPPYGVVGPESHNKNILVHDFTHRLHMDIFGRQYYPPSLTDWSVEKRRSLAADWPAEHRSLCA